MTFFIDWHGDDILKSVEFITADVCREVAEMVADDAKHILRTVPKTHSAHPLYEQIKIKTSKFKGGGSVVVAQPAGDWVPPYRASFVELGTHKTRNRAAQPYMRPARKKNLRKAKALFKDRLNAK